MDKPNFLYEKKLWRKDFKFVAGLDEVGRGCFAGPVVAAACVFAPNSKFPASSAGGQFSISKNEKEKIVINDSKKLTPKQREKASEWIKENSLAWGIGEGPASLINRVGLGKATKVAFRRAIIQANSRLDSKIDFLLIDAFYIPFVRGIRRKNQLAIIDGDEKIFSVAAASIIAKVYRDKLMVSLSKKPKYKKYGWGRNKGYGTKEHQEAIKKYGITGYHRKSFVSTFLKG